MIRRLLPMLLLPFCFTTLPLSPELLNVLAAPSASAQDSPTPARLQAADYWFKLYEVLPGDEDDLESMDDFCGRHGFGRASNHNYVDMTAGAFGQLFETYEMAPFLVRGFAFRISDHNPIDGSCRGVLYRVSKDGRVSELASILLEEWAAGTTKFVFASPVRIGSDSRYVAVIETRDDSWSLLQADTKGDACPNTYPVSVEKGMVVSAGANSVGGSRRIRDLCYYADLWTRGTQRDNLRSGSHGQLFETHGIEPFMLSGCAFKVGDLDDPCKGVLYRVARDGRVRELASVGENRAVNGVLQFIFDSPVRIVGDSRYAAVIETRDYSWYMLQTSTDRIRCPGTCTVRIVDRIAVVNDRSGYDYIFRLITDE